MKSYFIKAILLAALLLSPLLSAPAHAQTTNKIVTVENDPAYSGTYAYVGTRNGYPYYKLDGAGIYLYVDYYLGSFLLWVIGGLASNPDADDVKYYRYSYDDPEGDPGDPELPDWYEALPNTIVNITITDAASGVAPTVSTDEATLVTTTSGTLAGNIIADGGAEVSRGFVYSPQDATPTIGEVNVTQVTKGTGAGMYTHLLSALTPGGVYYYQAYGTNTYGTAYGGVKSFTTPTSSQPNKMISGIASPSAANGVYVWIGNYYGKPAWKHETQNYWLYYSRYGNTFPNNYYWYIDDLLTNEHGDELYLFFHADAASCPASGWEAKQGSGTVAIADYPNIGFTNGAAFNPGSPAGATNNNPIGRFSLSGELSGASLTAATISVSGTRAGVANLKLWSSTDNAFSAGSDTLLNSQADGASVVFSGFSPSAISTSGTYYFITADLDTNASGSLSLTVGSKANLTIGGGSIASDFSAAPLAGGLVDITAVKEINLKGNSVTIADGAVSPNSGDHTDFGSADVVTGSVVRTFTIENLGAGTLALTGSLPYVVISGATSDFSLIQLPAASIAGGGSTTFQVTFDPASTGTKSATISIANDDGDENPYDFSIQGEGVAAPEMNVLGKVVSIADGDTTPAAGDDTDFGSTNIAGGSVEHTFTIINSGSAALSLTGVSPYVAIAGDTGDFSVSQAPSNSIPAGGGSTTFKVTFNPAAAGLRSATISIANNDGDENPYNFSLHGQGVAAPEIDILGKAVSIADGDTTPAAGDDTDFGLVDIASGSVEHTFTIANLGSAALVLPGAVPYVVISGDTGDFSLSQIPSNSITAGGTTTFKVTFNPAATGEKSAAISIANNDVDENPYNFTIQGEGVGVPGVTTSAATAVTTGGATLGGVVTAEGGYPVGSTGVVYSATDPTPTIGEAGVTQNSNADHSGAFSEAIAALSPATHYYYQAYATNLQGTAYGGVVEFTTLNTVLSIARSDPDRTNAASVDWEVQFEAPVAGLSAVNFSLVSTGLSGAAITAVHASGDDTWTVTAGPGTGAGTLALNLTSDAGLNAGLSNLPFAGAGYTIDRLPPAVTIDQAVGQSDPSSAPLIHFTVAFSEPVVGFTAADVIIGGTAFATMATITGSGATYAVAVGGMTRPGTVILSVPAGVAQDAAANPNTASTAIDDTVASARYYFYFTFVPVGDAAPGLVDPRVRGPR